MKTKILLCTLCLASFGLRAQDVAPLPEGRWTLTGTVIQKAIGADNRSNELYTPDVHANPLDCIYPVLNIEAGLCHMESNERKDEVTCTYNGRGELTLWYSAPV
ncbi:MAG: hypothetical protein LBJ58_08335, partial [Tannerellaceae bacterium]|nr:hypothetical protein [Tannerellaceae bacterium]